MTMTPDESGLSPDLHAEVLAAKGEGWIRNFMTFMREHDMRVAKSVVQNLMDRGMLRDSADITSIVVKTIQRDDKGQITQIVERPANVARPPASGGA